MLQYVTTRHYDIRLSVDKIIIIKEINKNEKYTVTFRSFICMCGVFMVSQQYLV